MAKLAQALESVVCSSVLYRLLWSHGVRHRLALDEHGAQEVVVPALSRLLEEKVNSHLAELG